MRGGEGGTLNVLTVGAEKGGSFKFFQFLFQILFAKYGFFWFCFCLLREMKWNRKGTFH